MRWVADLLRENGLDEKSLGLEMDGYWFNARMYVVLSEALPRAKLMDGTNLVNEGTVSKLFSDRPVKF